MYLNTEQQQSLLTPKQHEVKIYLLSRKCGIKSVLFYKKKKFFYEGAKEGRWASTF